MDGVCIVAIPAGDGRVSYNDGGSAPLHQTLVYLGSLKDIKLSHEQRDELAAAVGRIAQFAPFTAKVGGVATLGPDRDRVVLTESATLQRMHDVLLQNAVVAEIHSQNNTHPSWISHITTDKYEHGDNILFDRVGLWIGKDKTMYNLSSIRKLRPNSRSTPKEIVGSHGHRSHGKSILWPALYEHLRAKGYSKEKSARISNSAWNKKRAGMRTNTPTSARGVLKSSVLGRAWDIVLAHEDEATHPGGQ